jgi:hypothetical protein
MKTNSVRARSASPLSETFCRKLNSYAVAASAAGVGALALAGTAQAKIIYHHADIKLEPDNGGVYLDLNHDGIDDFHFTNGFSVQLRVRRGSDAYSFSSMDVKPALLLNGVYTAESRGGVCAAALKKNVTVGPESPFKTGETAVEMAFDSNGGAHTCPWVGVKGAYLGVKFNVNGKDHYGWVRVNELQNGTGGFPSVIVGYAYESVAGKAIMTGATSGGDVAKGSLGALARGK